MPGAPARNHEREAPGGLPFLRVAGRGARAGPKAWFTAQPFRLEGKEAVARHQWQSAESVLRERLLADPQNLHLRLKLAVPLASGVAGESTAAAGNCEVIAGTGGPDERARMR
jgi:hypothetical protein